MENRTTLVSDDFIVPSELATAQFRLRMLTINDLIKDYDAVMSSVDHLRNTYSLISGSNWPMGLTLEEDLIDLGWHQREFMLRYSFAYTVMTLDETRCLGCVYLDPSRKSSFDVVISMWVRASELGNGLDSDLYGTVKRSEEHTSELQSRTNLVCRLLLEKKKKYIIKKIKLIKK